MNNALLVAQREYTENIRTRGFWLGIIMMPVILFLIGIIPILVESTRAAKTFVVIDKSGWLLPLIQQHISAQDLAYYLLEPASQAASANKLKQTPLDKLKQQLSGLTVTEITALSTFLAHPSTTQQEIADKDAKFNNLQLTPDLTRAVKTNQHEINRWWTSLPLDKKSALSSRISSNRFILETSSSTDTSLLNDALRDGKLFAYFIIGDDPLGTIDPDLKAANEPGSYYVSNNLTDRDLLNWFSDIINENIFQARLKKTQVAAETIAWINQPFTFSGLKISNTGTQTSIDTKDIIRQWAPVVFVYLLWISILINTQMLLTNTIEEKSNKLIEVLLSSVSPMQLMAGKIIGIALTGLTIIFSWLLMSLTFFIFLPWVGAFDLPVDLTTAAFDPIFLGSFLVYFLLGYLLYAAILVGLGSIFNNLKEAQNLMLPVQLVQMLPILLMIPVGRDPNGLLAQVLSYIPPLTPFVMMNRAAGPPSTFEYISTTLLLVLAIFCALWVAARIFRMGILMTGNPPEFRQVLKWIRTPVAAPKKTVAAQ
ncbi:MAG: ABC transporter permease [Pseudomonadales bacterium]|nr:ABC transporter permease [Pseudomonadales bacterium]